MGTRGMIAVEAGRRELIAYNHFDSYPSGLGRQVVGYVNRLATDPDALSEARRKAREVVVVDEQATPTPEQAARFAATHNRDVSTGSDWYSVLRDAQGDIGAYLDLGAWPDSGGRAWPQNSLFCEYGYLVDLDRETLEFYVGFQTEAHNKGRFATEVGREGYYPIALVKSWTFAEVAERVAEVGDATIMVAEMAYAAGDEDE